MRQDEAETAVPLIPPRPNLGPEAWPEASWPGMVIAGTCVVLLCLIVVVVRRRRQRKPSSASPAISPGTHTPTTDHERLAAWAEEARSRLINRFGPPWAAKTTEEIEEDPRLNELLDHATFEKLLELLRAADRAKFAEIVDQGNDWTPWVDAFLAGEPRAGASSMTNGR